MAAVTERYKSSFNLALEDNFYTDGVIDVEDKRFKVSWTRHTFRSLYSFIIYEMVTVY